MVHASDRGGSEQGARKHEYDVEELERAEQNARHARSLGSRSWRWLWTLIGVTVLLAALFVVYQVVVPADPTS